MIFASWNESYYRIWIKSGPGKEKMREGFVSRMSRFLGPFSPVTPYAIRSIQKQFVERPFDDDLQPATK
jgi:hypothetical protein